jgi:hypothetical protein
MTTTYTKEPDGYWFKITPDHPASKGQARGMIYPPDRYHKTWRICYGTCTEHASHMQGKVSDFNTLAACKHQLHLQFAYF